jgi:predicted DNA-binding WGR domain protein
MPSDTVYLRRIDPGRHMARFYALAVDRDLFGQVILVREWGRIGMSCRTRHDPHASEAEASAALTALARTKRARGYAEVSGS